MIGKCDGTCVNIDGDSALTVEFVEHAITASGGMATGHLQATRVQCTSQHDPGCVGRVLAPFRVWHNVGGYEEDMPCPSG